MVVDYSHDITRTGNSHPCDMPHPNERWGKTRKGKENDRSILVLLPTEEKKKKKREKEKENTERE